MRDTSRLTTLQKGLQSRDQGLARFDVRVVPDPLENQQPGLGHPFHPCARGGHGDEVLVAGHHEPRNLETAQLDPEIVSAHGVVQRLPPGKLIRCSLGSSQSSSWIRCAASRSPTEAGRSNP